MKPDELANILEDCLDDLTEAEANEAAQAIRTLSADLAAKDAEIERLREALTKARPWVADFAADGYPPPVAALSMIDAALNHAAEGK
jgi:hypothetical protein